MEKVITFPSKIENISFAENLVDEISDIYKFSSEIYGNILVSIVEAVNNAITHGNKLDDTKTVTIRCMMNGEFVKFIVSDQGDGFDVTTVPDPTTAENIEKPHGRGIFLMNHLADEISFLGDGTEVELKFKIL